MELIGFVLFCVNRRSTRYEVKRVSYKQKANPMWNEIGSCKWDLNLGGLNIFGAPWMTFLFLCSADCCWLFHLFLIDQEYESSYEYRCTPGSDTFNKWYSYNQYDVGYSRPYVRCWTFSRGRWWVRLRFPCFLLFENLLAAWNIKAAYLILPHSFFYQLLR